MATDIQTYASAPDDMPYELFVYLIYDESKFSASGPGKVTFEGSYYPASSLPSTDKPVGWYLDANYTKPATTTYVDSYILNMDIGNNYIFGGINLYGRLEEKQVRFREGVYAAAKFENGNSLQASHNPGTIFMATVGETVKEYAHLIYDDGTYFMDVIPRMQPLLYGGTGLDLTIANNNSVIIKESTALGHVASANGAFYSTGADAKPQFGTLPVKQGGTGKTSFTKYGIVYGNSSSALKVTAAGAAGTVLVGTGAAPKFVAPGVSWTGGTTEGPIFNLTIDATVYSATIPSASATASGIVTTGAQTFKGVKTFSDGITINGPAIFNDTFSIVGTEDAYYNSDADNKVGALNVIGGITTSMNMRVDGGTIQFAKAARIKYDSTKECFNFVF